MTPGILVGMSMYAKKIVDYETIGTNGKCGLIFATHRSSGSWKRLFSLSHWSMYTTLVCHFLFFSKGVVSQKMAPSLTRQRNSSTISLRSSSETQSSSALKTPSWSDEEVALRGSASSCQSVTSNRSGRSQQRKALSHTPSVSTYGPTNQRTSRTSKATNSSRRRDDNSIKPDPIIFVNGDKRCTLSVRVAILICIILNLTKSPSTLNHDILIETNAMTDDSAQLRRTRQRPRFLFGIFSTLRETDAIRRSVIRRTYLASDPDRICSVKDLVNKPHCQIVYTFVLGANATGPTDMVDQPPQSLTVDTREEPILDEQGRVIPYEDDVTYLNLRENMEDGKSPSWFLYANTIVDNLGVDFIAKVDSDTLVFPTQFLDEFASFLPIKDHASNSTTVQNITGSNTTSDLRVYGGIPNDSIGCGGLRRPHCTKMGGKTYMQGQLHFLSVDLSRYVTSIPREIRRELFVPIEDLCTAKYVHSHPKPVMEAVVSREQHLWEHGKHIKDPVSYERRWNQVIRETQQQQQPHKVVKQGETKVVYRLRRKPHHG